MKKAIGALTATALALTGIVATAELASANVRAPFSYTIHRQAAPGEVFQFNAGQSAIITATISLGPDWTGWPGTRPSTMTFGQGDLLFTESTFPDDVSSAPGLWHYYSSTDPETCDYWSLTDALSLSISRSCVDTVDLVTQLYAEQFESDQSIDFNIDSWAITRSGVAQSEATNMTWSIVADVTGETDSTTALDLQSTVDTSVSVSVEGCVNESAPGLADGDAVVQEVAVAIDGVVVSETSFAEDPVVTWTTAPSYDEEGNEIPGPAYPDQVVSFTSDPPENVTFRLDGEIANINGSSLTIDYDITKNGVSVAEDCPIAVDYGIPTISDTTQSNSVFDATTTSHQLPAGFSIDSTNSSTVRLSPDGFGGQFLYSEDEWGEATTSPVYHLTPDGVDETFNGDGDLAVTSSIGMIEFTATAWGVDGNRWATLSYTSGTKFTITRGTFGSSSTSTLRARISKIDDVCGSGWFGSLERFLPLQTSKLLVEIQCSKYTSTRAYNKTVIARVTADATTPFRGVFTIGSPTRKYPTTCSAIGIDPTATGTEKALIAISRKLKYTKDSCSDMPASGTITVNKITAGLETSTGTIESNPFADGTYPSWPSESMSIVPGESANTWRGIQTNVEWDDAFENSTTTWTPFTISSRNAITELPDITATDHFDTGNFDVGNLVATPGSPNWVFFHLESDIFDDVETTYATTSFLDPSTGEGEAGESVELTDYGIGSTWMLQGATSENGVPLYYIFDSSDTYTVVRWDIAN